MFNWTTRMFQVSAMCRTQEIIIQRHQENNHEPKPQDATSKNNKRHSNNQPRQLWFLKLSTFNTLWNRQKIFCAFAEQARGIVGHLCGFGAPNSPKSPKREFGQKPKVQPKQASRAMLFLRKLTSMPWASIHANGGRIYCAWNCHASNDLRSETAILTTVYCTNHHAKQMDHVIHMFSHQGEKMLAW